MKIIYGTHTNSIREVIMKTVVAVDCGGLVALVTTMVVLRVIMAASVATAATSSSSNNLYS
jgi:hypothetical protein